MSIVLDKVTKRFENNVVVNKVSLEITDGELFVLLGGSGSGKSTILRMIAGLSEPTSGTIGLNGRDVTYLPPQARGAGFVFQNYSIFRHMTVAENIEFGLRIRKVPRDERRSRCDELLDLVDLAGLGARYADQLSGGQQQRVALARALAYNPEVLLLDEPFGALDVKIRAQLRHSLKNIQRQLRVTTILVTHDQEEAFELADRVGVIERGHLIEVGRPEELYHQPRTAMVAAFIGGGNVLAGREDQGQIRIGSRFLPIPEGTIPLDPGEPVRILFRPETVRLSESPIRAGKEVFVLGQGKVVERIFAGAFQRLVLEVENLRGIRPLIPSQVYGHKATRIEAVQASQNSADFMVKFEPGKSFWVGLESYHLLEPAGIKILACTREGSTDENHLQFACRLAQATDGRLTILGVASAQQEIEPLQENLENVRRQWLNQLPRLETRVRQGSTVNEILYEAQEGEYEIVVLGREKEPGAHTGVRLSPVARQIMVMGQIPLLLIHEPRPTLSRMLICTATGEPGKSDVLVGGRLARRAKAQVTVLHVLQPGAPPRARRRTDRHLSQAQASLESLGVKCETRLVDGPVLQNILSEAEGGNYDMIVIGAPAPPKSLPISRPDFAAQILSLTDRPILIVPMVG